MPSTPPPYGTSYRQFGGRVDFDNHYLLPTSGSFPAGRRDAGWTDKPGGLYRYIDTVVGANKMFEVIHGMVVPVAYNGNTVFPTSRVRVVQIQNRSLLAATATGECFQGIEIGSYVIAPPWAATTSPGGQIFQLRWNHTLTRWEFSWYPADGNVATVQACSVQPPFLVDQTHCNLELIADQGNQTAVCMIDGQVIHTFTDPTLALPDSNLYGGYFCTNGTNALNKIVEAGFGPGFVDVGLITRGA